MFFRKIVLPRRVNLGQCDYLSFCSTVLGVWTRAVQAMVVKAIMKSHGQRSLIYWNVLNQMCRVGQCKKLSICMFFEHMRKWRPGKQAIIQFIRLTQRLKQGQNQINFYTLGHHFILPQVYCYVSKSLININNQWCLHILALLIHFQCVPFKIQVNKIYLHFSCLNHNVPSLFNSELIITPSSVNTKINLNKDIYCHLRLLITCHYKKKKLQVDTRICARSTNKVYK